MADLFAPTGAEAIKTYICTQETAEAVLVQLSDAQQKIAQFHGFDGGLSRMILKLLKTSLSMVNQEKAVQHQNINLLLFPDLEPYPHGPQKQLTLLNDVV